MNGQEKKCCPVLRMAAERERLEGCGIRTVQDGVYGPIRGRVQALMIALARERYGCDGPNDGMFCPYSSYYEMELETDPSVPLLKPRVDDGQDHRYL